MNNEEIKTKFELIHNKLITQYNLKNYEIPRYGLDFDAADQLYFLITRGLLKEDDDTKQWLIWFKKYLYTIGEYMPDNLSSSKH